MSAVTDIFVNATSPAFASSKSFSDFFFIYQMSLIGSCSFVGFFLILTVVVVCLRKYVCLDAEAEDQKPLALKAQEEADAAQWGIKNTLQILIGLAVFGLSAAAVSTPIVTFPDGTDFYYLARCRGDACQEWSPQFYNLCSTLSLQFGYVVIGSNTLIALICAGSAGAVYILILMIELGRRCFPDRCLGHDPDTKIGNPSKGYYSRWFLLVFRILVLGPQAAAIAFTVQFVLQTMPSCVGPYVTRVNIIQAGGSYSSGFFCLCIAPGFALIDIWLESFLSEVGSMIPGQTEHESELHALDPPPRKIVPITKDHHSVVEKGASASPLSQINNPSNEPTHDDDTKKLSRQQQVVLDNMKKEMMEQQQQFMLNLQQQQSSSPSFQILVPSAQNDDQSQQFADADPTVMFGSLHRTISEQQKQQEEKDRQQQEKDRQHQEQIAQHKEQIEQHKDEILALRQYQNQANQQFAQHQNQILALHQLVQQLQPQNNNSPVISSVPAVTIDPSLPRQTGDSQTLQPQQNQSPLKTLNTDGKINPLAAAATNDDDDSCRVDIDNDDRETTDKKKKKDKSSKSSKKHQDNAPDSATASRREKFEAQQRMIQQLQDEQQALMTKLQTEAVESNNPVPDDGQPSQQRKH